MFSGIVEELGRVVAIDTADETARLIIDCSSVTAGSGIGASVAVNGVCLTVVENTGSQLSFELSRQTLEVTSLGRLVVDEAVNLERPVTLATRLGGHIVQGHVDGLADVVSLVSGDLKDAVLSVRLPADLMRFVVEKGSITIDGVSLTVASLEEDVIEVAVIPHTLAVTTLGSVRPGMPVNIEVDVLAKYVATQIQHSLITAAVTRGDQPGKEVP